MKSLTSQLGAAFLVCVIAIIGYGFWYAAIEAKSTAVATIENQILTRTETASRIASVRTSLAEISGDEASVQNYFLPETGVVSFINNLEDQGKKQGSSVSVLSVATNTIAGQSVLAFTLSIKGTFDAVMRTIGNIEYAPYDLSISTLAISQDGKNGWHADLTFLVGSSPTATTTPL